MEFLEKAKSLLTSEKANDAVDYTAGGGLISGSIYADLSNALHLIALVAGTLLIILRLRYNWRNRDK